MVSRLAVLLTCTVVVPAFAQDRPAPEDSLPFRRGQWAAHFTLGGFGGIGVTRFRSPSRATLLQVSVFASHRESAADDLAGGVLRSVSSSAGLSARLGWRRYRLGYRRITPYVTAGPAFSFSHNYISQEGSGTSSQDSWSLGVFGDVGALYHVSPSLALGAAGGANLSYGRSSTRLSTGPRGSSWDIQLSGVTVGAGLTLLF